MKKLGALLLALMLVLMAVPAYADGTSTDGVVCYSPENENDFYFEFPLQNWEFKKTGNGYILNDKNDPLGINSVLFTTSDIPMGLDVIGSLKQLGVDYLIETVSLMYGVNNDDYDTQFHTGREYTVNGYDGFYLEGTSKASGFTVRFDLVLWATPKRMYNIVLLSREADYTVLQPAFTTMLSTFRLASEASEPAQPAKQAAPSETGRNNAASIPFIPDSSDQYQLTETQIQETVLADDSNIRIVVTSLYYYPSYYSSAIDLKLNIQNKTNQTLTVTNETLHVNGYEFNGIMYEQVEPGKTIEGELTIERSELRQAGIPMVADLSMSFSVSSKDYSLIYTTPVTKLRTDAPADFVQTLNENGMCLYEDDDVTIIARFLEPLYGKSYYLVILVENHTGNSIYVETKKVKINGIDVDKYTNDFLTPGSNSICRMWIDESDLNKNQITKIDSISLQFGVTIHGVYRNFLTDLVDIPIDY